MKQSSVAFDLPASSSHSASVKSFSGGKSQAVLADRWDHSGFDQLEQENRTLQNKSSVAKPKREKRPDRQLYNVRQRVNQPKPVTKTPAKSPERLNCSVIEKIEESSPYLQTVKDVLKAFEYKEVNSFEDDRLSVSNVSTAISERLKGIDEESYIKSETIKEKEDSIEILESPIVVLFDMMMETPNGLMNLRVHEGDDYEQILENACIEANLDTKTSLHFKINLLQTIANMLENPEDVNRSLDALLDLNYQMLMNENCLEELDQ